MPIHRKPRDKIKILLINFTVFVSATNLWAEVDSLFSQVRIPFGNSESQIKYCLWEFDDVTLGGFDIDYDGNIFIADLADSSVKKYSSDGHYIDRLKIPGVLIYNVIIRDKKLFIFDKYRLKNDLYIFSTDSLKLMRIFKHIFPEYLTSAEVISFDGKLLFVLHKFAVAKVRYHGFDMDTEILKLDIDSPFAMLSGLETKEKQFLEELKPSWYEYYMGRINEWLLFSKGVKEYRIALFKLRGNEEKLELKLMESELGKSACGALRNHWQLKKERFVYFLGYYDDYLIVNKIDLKKSLLRSQTEFGNEMENKCKQR